MSVHNVYYLLQFSNSFVLHHCSPFLPDKISVQNTTIYITPGGESNFGIWSWFLVKFML